MHILEIIPLQKGIPRDTLSYFSIREIPLGSLVAIPFRSNTITGIVINSTSARDIKANLRTNSFSLKPVGDVMHQKSFPSTLLRGLREISQNTFIPLGTLITTFFSENSLDYYLDWKPSDTKTETRIIELPEKKRLDYYVLLAKESLSKKKSILFVAPTNIQCEKIVKHLEKSFDKNQLIQITGAIKPEKRDTLYGVIAKSSEPLILCITPQFFIIPTHTIGSCIIDSYHSEYYIQDFGQRFDYRFIIKNLARMLGYHQYYADIIHCPEFTELINDRKAYLDRETTTPSISVPISLVQKETHNEPHYVSALFGSQTISLIRKKIAEETPVFIFVGRKSIATATVCRDCNYTVTCPNCTAVMHLIKKNPLVESDRVFICNRCETETPPMNRCPHCLGWNLIPLGVTIESVFDALQKIFPEATIMKSTQEITKTESACKKLITQWKTGGNILIGTQKIIPYIDEIPVSIIASYDQCISVPDYQTTFATLYLFQQIYEKTTERMIIQSRDTARDFLTDYSRQNLKEILSQEESLRREFHFPPYAILIILTLPQIARKDHMRAKDFLKLHLQPFEHTLQSQFFEHTQTYQITGRIHIPKDVWNNQGIEVRELQNFMQIMRSDADIAVFGIS